MSTVKNILFIMADQLRFDYLSCYGHPHLQTPNIDRLAARGLRFDRAYVQSPVCGPSRASFYTGRTVFSHGATWNRVPLPIGELTLGDYLRLIGVRTAVVGKTHMMPDKEGMARLGLNETTEIGCLISQPGFDPYERVQHRSSATKAASFAIMTGCANKVTRAKIPGTIMRIQRMVLTVSCCPAGI